MWERVRPGGWLQVFDFRFNNPRNQDVRQVVKSEFARLDPVPEAVMGKLLLTPPPIARSVCRVWQILDPLFAAVFPFARSHRLIMLQRPT
jgi:hypothetical protein